MICWRTKLLQLPNIMIFAVLLSVATVLATACNTLVLIIILRMKKKSISYHILLSLCIADVLIGFVLGPLTITQMLDAELLSNCLAHYIRGHILVLLVGSSLLTLVLVSYDRYLLLTKLSNYNQYITNQKAALLILFSWIFPGLIPIVKQFSMITYVILRIINFTLPLVALATFYFLITKEVIKREREFLQHNKNRFVAGNSSSLTKITSGCSCMSATSTAYHFHNISFRNQRKHLSLAKSVTLLITCYFACIFPLNIWMVFELIKLDYSIKAHQIFYLSAVFLMQMNSCINPVIYYLKQRDIRKGFWKIFKPASFRSSLTTEIIA